MSKALVCYHGGGGFDFHWLQHRIYPVVKSPCFPCCAFCPLLVSCRRIVTRNTCMELIKICKIIRDNSLGTLVFQSNSARKLNYSFREHVNGTVLDRKPDYRQILIVIR